MTKITSFQSKNQIRKEYERIMFSLRMKYNRWSTYVSEFIILVDSMSIMNTLSQRQFEFLKIKIPFCLKIDFIKIDKKLFIRQDNKKSSNDECTLCLYHTSYISSLSHS